MTDVTPIPAAARLADWDLFLIIWYPHSGGRWLNRGLLQRHTSLAMGEFFSPFLHHSTDQLLRLDQTEQVHKARSLPALEDEFKAVFRSVDAARHAGIAAYFAEKRELMVRSAPGKRHGGVLPVGAQVAVPDLRLLTELLPRLKLVHLIRHPVDCFRSLASRYELDGNPYRIGATWAALNASTRAIGLQEPGRYRCLRYEDLAANPEAEMKSLLEWLGIEFDPAVRDGFAEYHGRNHGRDLTDLVNDTETEALMAVAGGEAAFYGYQLPTGSGINAQFCVPVVG